MAEVEEQKEKKPFEGIEKRSRFETQPILGRDVEFRVKYSVREKAFLGRQLDKLQDYKISKKISDEQIEKYATTVSDIASLIVRNGEDAEFIKNAVLDLDSDSDEFIDEDEFLDLIGYVLGRNDDEAEVDTGKAESGSVNS